MKFDNLIDRQFLVVDDKNRFITGRQFSKLVTIKAHFDGQILTLNGSAMDQIEVNVEKASGEVETEVFGMKCQGLDLGPEIGTWIRKFLGKENINFKLIYHKYSSKASSRQLQSLNMDLRPLTKESDVPLFADGYGFLLVNEQSVDILNQQLTDLKVNHQRFRPNIVVEGICPGRNERSERSQISLVACLVQFVKKG